MSIGKALKINLMPSKSTSRETFRASVTSALQSAERKMRNGAEWIAQAFSCCRPTHEEIEGTSSNELQEGSSDLQKSVVNNLPQQWESAYAITKQTDGPIQGVVLEGRESSTQPLNMEYGMVWLTIADNTVFSTMVNLTQGSQFSFVLNDPVTTKAYGIRVDFQHEGKGHAGLVFSSYEIKNGDQETQIGKTAGSNYSGDNINFRIEARVVNSNLSVNIGNLYTPMFQHFEHITNVIYKLEGTDKADSSVRGLVIEDMSTGSNDDVEVYGYLNEGDRMVGGSHYTASGGDDSSKNDERGAASKLFRNKRAIR